MEAGKKLRFSKICLISKYLYFQKKIEIFNNIYIFKDIFPVKKNIFPKINLNASSFYWFLKVGEAWSWRLKKKRFLLRKNFFLVRAAIIGFGK